jgi:hypothetical protein
MDDDRRYINPRMEEELRQFKEKIAVRLKNGQIPKDFKFPRLTDPSPQTLVIKDGMPSAETLIFSP